MNRKIVIAPKEKVLVSCEVCSAMIENEIIYVLKPLNTNFGMNTFMAKEIDIYEGKEKL